jgi:hypothetical protein
LYSTSSSLTANDRIGCTIVIAFMWSTRRRRRSTTSTATAQVIPTRAQLQGQRRGIGLIRALEAASFEAGDDVEIAGVARELDPGM